MSFWPINVGFGGGADTQIVYQFTSGTLLTVKGYNLASGIGTLTSPVDGHLHTPVASVAGVLAAIQDNTGAPDEFVTSIEGFLTDPTVNYFKSIVANGTVYAVGTAVYTYTPGAGSDGSGLAGWKWNPVAGFVTPNVYVGYIQF